MAHGNVSRCEESSLHDVCCGRLSALTDRELSERLTALPGWELVDGKLRHTFGFGSFDQSMKFVAKIAAIADKFNHHPDIRRCPQSRRSGRSRSGVSQRSIGYRTGVGRPRPPGHRNRCVRCRAAAAGQRGRASRRGRSAQPRAGRLGLLGTRRDAFRAGAQQALLGCGDISPRL